jgi:pyridoxine 5-phosphate synthase
MTKLSVNINKIATLRNARGGNVPNLLKVASDIEKFGAQGITVHPRPDERHIRYADVYDLAKTVTTEFNIEGYPNPKFIELVLAVKPTQVTLVPDGPDVLTSNAGWNIEANKEFLKSVIKQFKEAGIRVSVFVEPDAETIKLVPEIGADRVELYTEQYAAHYNNKEEAIKPFVEAANAANKLGIGLNAGHDLSLENLAYFSKNIPNLLEVSIGHALIGDALYYGLEKTVGMYSKCLEVFL